jgi:hypothetical protein
MGTWSRRAAGTVAAGFVLLITANASALLLEKVGGDDELSEFTHFYPYPTSYTYVDDNYAFDDDPLTAFINEPYFMPVVVQPVAVRRTMVRPRTTFVQKMYQSTEAI